MPFVFRVYYCVLGFDYEIVSVLGNAICFRIHYKLVITIIIRLQKYFPVSLNDVYFLFIVFSYVEQWLYVLRVFNDLNRFDSISLI